MATWPLGQFLVRRSSLLAHLITSVRQANVLTETGPETSPAAAAAAAIKARTGHNSACLPLAHAAFRLFAQSYGPSTIFSRTIY